MTKLFVIGLNSTNGHFEDFQNSVDSYKNWCDETGKDEFFGDLVEDFDLDFVSLNEVTDNENENFDCFDDLLELLKCNENCRLYKKKFVVTVIYDIDSFKNYDFIINYLKSDFNYLEYPLSSDSGILEMIKFEEFIKVNCTL